LECINEFDSWQIFKMLHNGRIGWRISAIERDAAFGESSSAIQQRSAEAG
jgi:hypothetical protein